MYPFPRNRTNIKADLRQLGLNEKCVKHIHRKITAWIIKIKRQYKKGMAYLQNRFYSYGSIHYGADMRFLRQLYDNGFSIF